MMMRKEKNAIINLDEAIKDVTKYRNLMQSIRDKLNTGVEIEPDWQQQMTIFYEILVKPYAEAINMHDPGEKQYHDYKIIYDNSVEWSLKEGSFFSINMGIKFLNSLLGRLLYYKSKPDLLQKTSVKPDIESALARIHQVIRMFYTSAKIVDERRKNLQPLKITNEYDLQDILHCILKPQFPDINPEEYAPPVGKGSKRIDLVLKSARIVIELKVVFDNKKTTQVVDELKIDIESYHSHPACGTLYCFIYNPVLAIEDPEKIIAELSGTRTKDDHVFEVIIAIHPR